ncbi:collagen alpha-1(X) chain-like [Heterocephalus glaber]|uniref:Collagen alpha-1(X) chain-like n=1 Tax=Heterocephalus glaber TaxID=10181 RepID=A0AAX6SE88_HETGA|nr:collagen alpha-1(X) chain-like [Heterocephalus glaber]
MGEPAPPVPSPSFCPLLRTLRLAPLPFGPPGPASPDPPSSLASGPPHRSAPPPTERSPSPAPQPLFLPRGREVAPSLGPVLLAPGSHRPGPPFHFIPARSLPGPRLCGRKGERQESTEPWLAVPLARSGSEWLGGISEPGMQLPRGHTGTVGPVGTGARRTGGIRDSQEESGEDCSPDAFCLPATEKSTQRPAGGVRHAAAPSWIPSPGSRMSKTYEWDLAAQGTPSGPWMGRRGRRNQSRPCLCRGHPGLLLSVSAQGREPKAFRENMECDRSLHIEALGTAPNSLQEQRWPRPVCPLCEVLSWSYLPGGATAEWRPQGWAEWRVLRPSPTALALHMRPRGSGPSWGNFGLLEQKPSFPPPGPAPPPASQVLRLETWKRA